MSPTWTLSWKAGKTFSAKSLFLIAAFSTFLSATVHARTLTDALGTQVTVTDHPARIVTLAPSLGELAADVLGTDLSKIVGVSEYTDYPPTLKKVTSIGPYFRFNLERVLSLKPDLVLATTDGNPKEEVIHLRELGIPVIVVNTQSFAGIESSIQLVATALGNSADGERMVALFKQGLERIHARSLDKKRAKPRVLLQLGDGPLIVVGQESFLNEALEWIGAENVYGDAHVRYPRPSREDIIKRDPDEIIVLTLGGDLAPFKEIASSWLQFPNLKAVKNKQVIVFQGDALLRPSLRLLEGLSLLDQAVFHVAH